MLEGREYLVSESKYLKLDIDVPFAEMLNEAQSLRDLFIPYRQDDYENRGWHSLPLIGLSSKDPYAWDVYDYKDAREAAKNIKWTEISDMCPKTSMWLREVYPSCSYGRVRFMLLEAGGSIDFHRDTTHSILAAINVALSNHPNCYWLWKNGERMSFKPGDAYAMNLSYEHSVVNDSDEDRYHLIIHQYDFNTECKNLFLRSMEKQNVQGYFHYSTELF
jgi:hypothetical protein